MGIARIAVLIIAGIAAIGAAVLVRGISKPPEQEPQVVQAEPEVVKEPTKLVLVAKSDMEVGQRVTPNNLAWVEWPEKVVSSTFITKENDPEALEKFSGAIARVRIAKDEPITGRKLVNPGDAGFMAAVLKPGMRAVAVEIAAETSAGGFILPNDRVDILMTREVEVRDGADVRNTYVSHTILRNVRVLAIDQQFREVEDEQVVVGSTATVELSQRDAELLARADAAGDISLALRSAADGAYDSGEGESRAVSMLDDQGSQMKVFKYGKSSQVGMQ